MKISRQKKISKYLNFYVNNYGFRTPYQILVDGTYCFASLKNKHNIKDQLPRCFQSELKLLTTSCITIEVEKLGSKLFGAMLIVKQFAIHKCSHGANPVSGSECIKSMIGKINANRYMIATQDRELQDYIRNTPGVPLLYLHQKTPVLEAPSDASIKMAKVQISDRFNPSQNESVVLSKLKEKSGIEEKVENKRKRKKKKGGPNPLSCKKPKKVKQDIKKVSSNENPIQKRKRKKVRLPEHVKNELFKMKEGNVS